MSNMTRLEAVALALPEAERVDVEAWDGHPTFRVRGKSFVFTNDDATHLSVKLPKEEAAAVVASDPGAEPAGYGLGRHGWVALTIADGVTGERWDEVVEMVRTSFTLVAPKRLAAQVLTEDAAG
jgi:predicted DNA-binding protein (MmcQ/YjbR family)